MNKTLLLLGGRSEIGLACAHEFAARGFDVILAGRRSESFANLASDITIRHEVSCQSVEFDALEFGDHETFYHAITPKPDVVIYAIGVLGEQSESERDWNMAAEVIGSNYVGAVSILSIVANDLEQRGGCIIGISSVAGERGRRSNYIYGSAKAGFSTFLAGLRHRFASTNVTVITVKPGFVATRMTAEMDLPKRLTATPQRVAKAVYNAFASGKHTVYSLGVWRQIMFMVRSLPESIFVRTKL